MDRPKNEKAIQFLFLIDALKRSRKGKNESKNVEVLRRDIENAWQERFPDIPMTPISAATIGRHIKAMNDSGLYKIVTSKNSKDGYYTDRFLFEAAEFCIIAQALYRSLTLSVEETQNILYKFINQTDALGEGYLDIMDRQIRRTAPRRKSSKNNLPIIKTIMEAVLSGRQIAFRYYNWDAKNKHMREEVEDKESGKAKTFYVSPYYLVWETDECYLIGYEEGKQKHLSHFKISCITTSIHTLRRKCTPLREMKEFPRYSMKRTLPESVAIFGRQNGDGFPNLCKLYDNVKFSLDRYMRENIDMFHDGKDVVDVKLHFRAEYMGNILKKFNLDERTLDAKPTQTIVDGQRIYSAIITVQPNEGFYRWLMGNSNYVMVVEPAMVRNRLRSRLVKALSAIKQYERSDDKDPIDYDALKMKKQNDDFQEMWRDMFLIPSMD